MLWLQVAITTQNAKKHQECYLKCFQIDSLKGLPPIDRNIKSVAGYIDETAQCS